MGKAARENVALGRRLQAERLRQGLMQKEVARRADISVSFLGMLERGRKAPGLKVARRLAAALGLSIERLFYRTKR